MNKIPQFAKSSLSLILYALVSVSSALAGNWNTVPLGGGGYVTGLVSNSDGSAIYCRTDCGGAFRWVPTGDAAGNGYWVSLSDTMVPLNTSDADGLMAVDGIGVDPNDLNRLYIGAGSFYSGLRGIWRSDNQGGTWTQINATIRMQGNGDRYCGERLAVDPNNSNIIWYASQIDGLQKGVLSGTTWTWTQISSALVPAEPKFVVCDKNGGSTITYVGVTDTNAGGVYKSTDQGTTWAKVSGATLPAPRRAQISSNGTLYVTSGTNGAAKLLRGGTLSLMSTLPTGQTYHAVAVDPNDATGNTVYVASLSSACISRSVDGGTTWALQSSCNQTRQEPDGMPCLVGYWFGNTSSLLLNPANSNELWAGDYFGVARTRNAQNLGGTGSTWYMLQKGQEETVVLCLTSATSGAKLLTGVSDVGGARYTDVTVRPTGTGGSRTTDSGNITSLDFCESNPSVCARAWVESDGVGGNGAFSVDGGINWANFGNVDAKWITNGPVAGWETFDVGPYLRKLKASGTNAVTLVVKASTWQSSSYYLHFSSKEGANAPQLLVNGGTTFYPTADCTVFKGTPTTNSGTSAELQAQNYYNGTNSTRWFFLKFDLTSLPSINSATLRLYRLPGTDTNSFLTTVYSTPTTNWVEGDGGADNLPVGELTWTNMPTNLIVPPTALSTTYSAGGGRIAVSGTDSGNLVWVPIGTGTPAYYTKDRGMTWTASTGGPGSQIADIYTNGGSLDTSGLCLAADRANGNFYLGKFGGTAHVIYRSTDNGATWTQVSSVSNGPSFNMFSPQLVSAPVSPTCPSGGDVWLCDDGAYSGLGGGLWHSTNSATSWTTILSGTANRATAVSFGKSSTGSGYAVYISGVVGGVKGVFRSDDYGTTWVKLADPTIGAVTALAGDRQNYNSAYIGTGGRGTWHYDAGGISQYETENLTVAGSDGSLHQVLVDSSASAGARTFYNSYSVGKYVIYRIDVPQSGAYAMSVAFLKGPNRGIIDFAVCDTLGGTYVSFGGTLDLYSSTSPYPYQEYNLGSCWINAGTRYIKLKVLGKNTSSSGYYITPDYIKLTAQ